MPPPFMPQRVVLVVRDPDAANEIAVYDEQGQLDRSVRVIDVDLGRVDLHEPSERDLWARSCMRKIRDLPPGHAAKLEVLDVIDRIYEVMGADDRKPSFEVA